MALREMTQVERIFTYLANDQAGRKATETILGLYAPRAIDLSFTHIILSYLAIRRLYMFLFIENIVFHIL